MAQFRKPTLTDRPRASAARVTAPAEAETRVAHDGNAEIYIDGEDSVLVFGRQSYLFIGIGIALMVLGMLLMAGGAMPDPDTWDESLIYSFRRITLAPIVILSGLGVITYAILKK